MRGRAGEFLSMIQAGSISGGFNSSFSFLGSRVSQFLSCELAMRWGGVCTLLLYGQAETKLGEAVRIAADNRGS